MALNFHFLNGLFLLFDFLRRSQINGLLLAHLQNDSLLVDLEGDFISFLLVKEFVLGKDFGVQLQF